MSNNKILITAAGGNGTVIDIIDRPLSRPEYEARGKTLGDEMEQYGAEQAGFLVLDQGHFEMAGGEFCGNASRAAAILFSNATNRNDVSFTVSGFDGTVTASVEKRDENNYFVRCDFPGLPTEVRAVTVLGDQKAAVVDLGGIIHVVIDGKFPSDVDSYRVAHRTIMVELGLIDREAVGVVWFERQKSKILIHPVVWVNAVNTFFYEESCGSGSIAVGKVTGESTIVQPTGKTISVTISEGIVTLKSEMEIVDTPNPIIYSHDQT